MVWRRYYYYSVDVINMRKSTIVNEFSKEEERLRNSLDAFTFRASSTCDGARKGARRRLLAIAAANLWT